MQSRASAERRPSYNCGVCSKVNEACQRKGVTRGQVALHGSIEGGGREQVLDAGLTILAHIKNDACQVTLLPPEPQPRAVVAAVIVQPGVERRL